MNQTSTSQTVDIEYHREEDYFLPNLTLPSQTDYPLRRFGRQHLQYLKQFKRVAYTNLLTTCKLNQYLHDIDTQAQELFDRFVYDMAQRQDITKQLKAENQMERVRRMNNIRYTAEKMVNINIVYA